MIFAHVGEKKLSVLINHSIYKKYECDVRHGMILVIYCIVAYLISLSCWLVRANNNTSTILLGEKKEKKRCNRTRRRMRCG
jgi:hypothetical protein